MMVSQGNFKGAWTLKINCNKQCWINYILLLFLSHSYSWIYMYYKRINVSPLSYFPYIFSGIQKSLTRLTQPFTHFYVVLIYYWTYSRPEYSWNTLINNQSINLPRPWHNLYTCSCKRRNADGKFLPVFTKIILTATVRFYGIVTEEDVNTYDPNLSSQKWP